MNNNEKFSETLKKVMDEKGLTNYALAKMLNCSQTTIGQWTKSERLPRKQRLMKLAKILEVDENYLLTGIKSPESKKNKEIPQMGFDDLLEYSGNTINPGVFKPKDDGDSKFNHFVAIKDPLDVAMFGEKEFYMLMKAKSRLAVNISKLNDDELYLVDELVQRLVKSQGKEDEEDSDIKASAYDLYKMRR